tara:strand:- start:32 stop:814 length:783 start_codon:yes stop_codon:yes gene_type:complete
MKFHLTHRHLITKGVNGGSGDEAISTIRLPSEDWCKMNINTFGPAIHKEVKCHFLGEYTSCVHIMDGFPSFGYHACGDILITMVEMGYDLTKRSDLKRAKKRDKEQIILEYHRLIKSQPELFLCPFIREENMLKEIEEKEAKRNLENIKHLKYSIIKLLKDKPIKMPTSDINAHLKHKNLDEIKTLCDELYNDGEISFAGNGRYFILSDEEKKSAPKKTSPPKSEVVDVEKELEKLKGLLDKGLITQEAYDAKMNQLLGL